MSMTRRAASALSIAVAAALVTAAPAFASTAPVSCTPNPPANVNMDVARVVYTTGRQLGVSPTVMLAGFEAGLVESRMNNCKDGNGDSVGVFQQISGWGTKSQRTDVAYASTAFFNSAKAKERSSPDAGKLAQAVQGSAYPDRYGQVQDRAQQLIKQVEGTASAPVLTTQTVGVAVIPGSTAGWAVRGNGTVTPFGGAPSLGSPNGALAAPAVGIAVTPSGRGYWLVAADGGIFTFGDAGFYGSTGGMRLNQPVVGMAATPNGRGYWLAADDGGIFTFGDAPFRGAATGLGTASGVARTGTGYGVVLRDGRVLPY